VPYPSLPVRNRLLLSMSEAARAELGVLEGVELKLKDQLETAGNVIPLVYFPDSGLASVVASDGGKSIEVGMIGYEGMTGLSLLASERRATFDTMIQGAGTANRLEAGRLYEAFARSDEIRSILLGYLHAFGIQVASTASANGHAKLEARLARWLLMVSDRMGDSFETTHDFLGMMLAVRRSGVTLAVQMLESKGLIKAGRGTISIVDRDGLVSHTEGSYGMAEREYERIMGAKSDALLL
jgi:CRP-like cAMP-binding protein